MLDDGKLLADLPFPNIYIFCYMNGNAFGENPCVYFCFSF